MLARWMASAGSNPLAGQVAGSINDCIALAAGIRPVTAISREMPGKDVDLLAMQTSE
jgi:hypothetical protein